MDVAKYKRMQHAASVIQAHYRGHLARRAYKQLQDAVQKIQAHARGWHARKKVRKQKERVAHEGRFNAVMERHRQRIYILEAERRDVLACPASELDEWQARRHRAAVKVQAHWRGLVQRRKLALRSPEMLQREQAELEAQQLLNEALAMRKSVQVAQASSRGDDPSLSSTFTFSAARTDQSISVPLGSPGGLKGPAANPIPVSSSYMSSKRYQDLLRQVNGQLSLYKSQPKHTRTDPAQVNTRLKDLLCHYHTSAEGHVHAAHQRQSALAASEAVAAQLDAMLPLAQLPEGAQPQDFPRPARGTERRARASQAHALMLAEVRAGTRWWAHLRDLNHEEVQLGLLDEDAEKWQAMDQQWRRQWQAIEAEEASRMDPLAGLGRRSGPVPPLSDLAISEDQDQKLRQQRREDKQTAAMQAALKAAAARKAGAAVLNQGQPHSASSFGINAEMEAEAEPELPLPPPAQRPGSIPIVIPTAVMAQAISRPTTPLTLPSPSSSTSGMPTPRPTIADVSASRMDHSPAVRPDQSGKKAIAESVGGAVLDVLHDQSGAVGASPTLSSPPGVRQVIGQAVLDDLRKSRDAAALPAEASIRQGEQPRPSPQPGTVGNVGAAVMDLLQEQAGFPAAARVMHGPEVNTAVGAVVLDDIKQQKRAAARSDLTAAAPPLAPKQPSLASSVGAATLDLLHSQSEQHEAGGQRRHSQPEVESALGDAVLDSLQKQQNDHKMAAAAATGMASRPRAPPIVEMAVGDAYMDTLGQPRQPPVVSMEVGAAVLSSLDAQARAGRAGL